MKSDNMHSEEKFREISQNFCEIQKIKSISRNFTNKVTSQVHSKLWDETLKATFLKYFFGSQYKQVMK